MKKTAYFLIFVVNILTLFYATEQNHNIQAPANTKVTVPEILDTTPGQSLKQSESFEGPMATEGSSDYCPSTPITPRASSFCQETPITPRGAGQPLKKILEESKNSAASK